MVTEDAKITRVLIAYDGSGYSHAILNDLRSSGLPHTTKALIISVAEVGLPVNSRNAELYLNSGVTEYLQKHRGQAGQNLSESSGLARLAADELLKYFPEWSIEVEAVSGSPALEILLRAGMFQPDLIVIGERGLSSIQDFGLGSTSQTVLSQAKCPVRISRRTPPGVRSRHNIVIGFDGSIGSMMAIKAVAERPWSTRPQIRLITVTDPLALLKPGRALRPVAGMSEGKIEGEQKWVNYLAVDALRVIRGAGLSVSLHVYSGNPRMVLISEATKWNADAVFLGATAREPTLFSLGCVALAIANRAGCSVEVVRENISPGS